MKYIFIIAIFASIVVSDVYSLVPKYESNDPVISKLLSLDDTRYDGSYRQSKKLETPEVAEDGNTPKDPRFILDKLQKSSTYKPAAEVDSDENRFLEMFIEVYGDEYPADELNELIDSKVAFKNWRRMFRCFG